MTLDESTIDWLLQSDASIRWQTMRDLLDLPESQWMAERAKVETEGWGARLLGHQDADGQWAGGSFVPAGFTPEKWKLEGQPWTATCFALTELREFGLDPTSERARRTVDLVGENSFWDEGGQPYWCADDPPSTSVGCKLTASREGEVEECINGRTVADGAYFGVDVSAIVNRLLGERLDDGGWNCERVNGSVRSSFDTTINVLEGLLEFEKATGGTPGSISARSSGEEYLLKRHLFRRVTTGGVVDEQYLRFAHPNRWHYDILRAADYFRKQSILTGAAPDPRLKQAIEHIRSRRRDDGKWALDRELRGRVWFNTNHGPDKPCPWITLRAMRVLRWWDKGRRGQHEEA